MKYGYKVDIEQQCDYYKGSDEDFGSWSASYTNELQSIRKIKSSNECPDIVSDIDFSIGQTIYVVWAEYSTGNSFGCATKQGYEPLAVFSNKNCALDFVNEIWKHYDKIKNEPWTLNSSKFLYKAKDGQTFDIYVPWYGYFECLEEVNIEKMILQK